jgi:hypothetical protein
VDLFEEGAEVHSRSFLLLSFWCKCAIHVLHSFTEAWAHIWEHSDWFRRFRTGIAIEEAI